MQIMESDRSLSQYSIGRGETGLLRRMSQRKVGRSKSAPPGGLAVVSETSTKLSDWRQRFIEVPPPLIFLLRRISCCVTTRVPWQKNRIPSGGNNA